MRTKNPNSSHAVTHDVSITPRTVQVRNERLALRSLMRSGESDADHALRVALGLAELDAAVFSASIPVTQVRVTLNASIYSTPVATTPAIA